MSHDEQPVERWELVEREELADCRVFRVERRRMRRSGGPADFFVIDSPDWINVVALTDDDDLVLVEQWRHGVERVTLEIPGGMVDPGETPFRAAVRELLEETGHTAREWHSIGFVEPNPAIQTNRCHTFLALGARRTEVPRFDRNEECRVVLRPWAEAGRLVASGEICHALVVVGLHREGLRRAGVLEAVPVDEEPSRGT
ncbi:MAG: NUDIX hydrolase [Planctomycetota bacterium]|jgi:8-oxo-dGTP pyrophosphatase MutT (NUDIX family)